MARPPRMQFAGALYHLTTRGNRRERIVEDETDYGMLQKMMIEAKNWAGVHLYAWCLMPNHIHALVETVDANVSVFMQRWLTRYARYFNWRHHLVGHVFQGRFGSKLCQKDAYFKELIRYIHLNPYKVKTPGFVGVGGWKWSSHRYYLGQSAPESCQSSIHRALSIFGSTPAVARKAYTQFFADGLRDGRWEDFFKESDGNLLGDKSFRETFGGDLETLRMDKDRASWGLSSILQAAESCLGVTREELACASQRRSISRARQIVSYVAARTGHVPLTELAQAFNRDASAVSQMLRRFAIQDRQTEVNRLIRQMEQGQ